ncbi:DUF4912 domain-containing protein [bacterium]
MYSNTNFGQTPLQKQVGKNTNDLPLRYNETKLVIMPCNPSKIFAYWDINDKHHQEILNFYGFELFAASQAIIRFYDITNIEFNGTNQHYSFDVDVDFETRNWYVDSNDGACKVFCAEMGYLFDEGHFVILARSNVIYMPSDKVSDKFDANWMQITDEFRSFLESLQNKTPGSSDEIVNMLKQRVTEFNFSSSELQKK